jgi:hypothetical protein
MALYNKKTTKTHIASGKSGLNAPAMRNVYVMKVSSDIIQKLEKKIEHQGAGKYTCLLATLYLNGEFRPLSM